MQQDNDQFGVFFQVLKLLQGICINTLSLRERVGDLSGSEEVPDEARRDSGVKLEKVLQC